jgi:hypothetical protein
VPLLATLLVITVLLHRQRRVLVATLCLLAFVVLSFGNRLRRPGGGYHGQPLPWAVVQRLVPITENVEPVRLAIVVWLAVAFLAAIGLQAGLDWSDRVSADGRTRLHRAARRSLVALVVIACLVPLLPDGPRPAQPVTPTPTFFTSADVQVLPRGSIAMVVPIPNFFDDAPMIWQIRANMWFAQVGGYDLRPTGSHHEASFFPGPSALATLFTVDRKQNVFSGTLTAAMRSMALAELRAQHVSWVIVGGSVHPEALFALVRRLLGRPPSSVLGGVELWQLPTAN